MQLVLLSSGREDECLTVEFETNMSLAVDSVRLWSGSQVGRVVVDGDWTPIPCCASEGCRTAKFSFTYDAVQTPSASMWLAARDGQVAFMHNAVKTPSARHLVSCSRRPVECDTSIDSLNKDKLACRFGRASKKIEIPRHSKVSKGVAVTAPRSSFGWDELQLAVVSGVKGLYFFGLHEIKNGQRWTRRTCVSLQLFSDHPTCSCTVEDPDSREPGYLFG